ncbi:pentapeptide repeat-containing protein [Magnetospirillum aberrantis]|nr:pentapeptide repeat-containing protein [Magnetospirillum aberrantis]
MPMLSHMRHPTQLHSGDIDWSKTRLLVFSLDDGFRFLARQTFRKLGVREVLSTSVPADAQPMLAQIPDVALVDTDGDMDLALAFLRRVRDTDPEMPVLMVARATDRAAMAPALIMGIEGVVPKPVSGHELVHRVSDVLKEGRRLPAPQPKPQPAPPPAPSAPAATGGGAGNGRIGSGTYGGGHDTLAGKTRTGGGWLDDDVPATGQRISGGKLSWGDDDLPPAPAKPPAGSYGDDAPPPAPAKTLVESLAERLPEALRPKKRRKEEEDAALAERERWQAELAEAGHSSRDGTDVAGLDVDAIVAAHLAWLTSQGAEGKRADFKKMDLAGAGLSGTVLANAGFRDADLSDANLAEARLDGADFRYASLSAADLSAANLGVAQLRHCDLRLANLQGTSLRGADLSGARLGGAKLAGADFKGAILVGCDLSGADLSQVENLTQAQMDKAVFDAKSKLPPGVRRPRKDEG